MHPQHHDEEYKLPDLKQQFNILIGLAQILEIVVAMACRKPGTMGEKVTGSGKAVLGVLLAPILIILIGGPEDTYVAGGTLVFGLLAAAVHKQYRQKREKQGVRIHSHDVGISIFKSLNAEPPIVFFAGVLLSPLSIGLTAYLMVSAVALGISTSAMKATWQARRRALEDAELEQRMLMSMRQRDDWS
jgi:hypothetical protein